MKVWYMDFRFWILFSNGSTLSKRRDISGMLGKHSRIEWRSSELKLQDKILKLKSIVYEHRALEHDHRNFILTLLAAIFLPISSASTFFGMNMDTKTPLGPEGFSNWTASWIINSPENIQNSTRALASTINSSGTLTYSWKTYYITATCLVLTLPLSLTIGSILRRAYNRTAHYAAYWRLFVIVPGFAIFFLTAFNRIIPFGRFISLLGNTFPLTYLSWRLGRAIKSHRRVKVRMFVLLAALIIFVVSSLTGFPEIMLFTWLCLAFAWAWLQWRRKQKAREQETTQNEQEMTPISSRSTWA